MAQRRMFSRKITDSDTFTDMPLSAQCLYFHIAMAADDDGFVEGVNRIRRSIGASEDDLKLLFAKSFLIPFESGVVVVRQWHIHNYIQKDRYTPTTHTEELARLTVQETGEKGAYALIYEQITMPIGTTVSNPDTKCIQNGYRNGNAEAQRQTVKSPVNIGANKNVSRMDTDCIQNVSTGIGKGIDIDTGTGTKNDKKNTEEDNNIRRGRAGARAHARDNAGNAEDDTCAIGQDGNWQRSPRARAATAQLVVDCMAAEHLPLANYNEAFDTVYEAMEHHIDPQEILDAARQLDVCEFVCWKARMEERRDDMHALRMKNDEMAYEARRREWDRGDDKTPEELERLRLAYSGFATAPADDDDDLAF